MSKGWVKIHREMSSHWVWDCEFSTGQAWVDLLMSACHKPNKFQIKGQIVELKTGQLARSEVTLAKDWKWSRNRVRRFLNNLEKDGMIEQQKGHLTSIITICNYSSFQANDTAGDTANGTGNDTSEGHLTEHKQECLRIKELKNKDITPDGDVTTPTEKKKNPKAPPIDYSAVKEIWNASMTKAAKVTTITDKRKRAIKKLFDVFELDLVKFENYVKYVNSSPKCQWMFEEQDRGNGQVWQKKGFDYITSEACFLRVKEEY